MILSYNPNYEFKPIVLTIGMHLAIFASFFSFTAPSADISDYTPVGNFSMISFSDVKQGISEQKTIQPKKEQILEKHSSVSQTNSQNSKENSQTAKNNDSNSSSEIVYDAENLGNPQPQYPLLARRRGEEGIVLVRAFVDTNGNASNVEIFKSSSFELLDNAALQSIKKWHFVPAKKFGQHIASSVIIPINFKLT